jgi:hypothetical protein
MPRQLGGCGVAMIGTLRKYEILSTKSETNPKHEIQNNRRRKERGALGGKRRCRWRFEHLKLEI